jgi:hypothetical protein
MAGSIMATTTPNYGWDVPTSTDYVKDGAVAIETLGDDIDATLYTALGGAYPGLRLVKKQTIGTGVSSVTVTNAFSATYENYKIIVSGGASSATYNYISLQMGATTTGYKYNLIYAPYGGSLSLATSGAASSFVFFGTVTNNGYNCNGDIVSPFTAKRTFCNTVYGHTADSGTFGAVLDNTTSYTDFTLTPVSGTLTGGTIYVYGYGAS